MTKFAIILPLLFILYENTTHALPVQDGAMKDAEASNLGPINTHIDDLESEELISGISTPLTPEETIPLVTISVLKDVTSIAINNNSASVIMEKVENIPSSINPEVSKVVTISVSDSKDKIYLVGPSIIVPIVPDQDETLESNANDKITVTSDSDSSQPETNEQISIVNSQEPQTVFPEKTPTIVDSPNVTVIIPSPESLENTITTLMNEMSESLENSVLSLDSEPSQVDHLESDLPQSLPANETPAINSEVLPNLPSETHTLESDTQPSTIIEPIIPVPSKDVNLPLPELINTNPYQYPALTNAELVEYIEKELHLLLQGKSPTSLIDFKKPETISHENLHGHNNLEDKIILEVIPEQLLEEHQRPADAAVSIVLEQSEPSPSLVNLISLQSGNSTINSIRPNKPNTINKPKPSRLPYGIQSDHKTNGSSSNNFLSQNVALVGQAFQSIPNLFKPINLTLPGTIVPSFSWPSFTKIFNGLFKSKGSNETEIAQASLLRFENDCEEKTVLSNMDGIEKTLLCKSDQKSSSTCSKFCIQNGFVQGDCIDESYCVCHLIEEEKKFGLIFKHYKDEEDNNATVFEPASDPEFGKCQKCSCSSKCQKSGAYIGYCGNTCYCGTPWHDGSLDLAVDA